MSWIVSNKIQANLSLTLWLNFNIASDEEYKQYTECINGCQLTILLAFLVLSSLTSLVCMRKIQKNFHTQMRLVSQISWSTINFKTENGSRLITEYYAFTIRVDQVNFLREKFGVSAYSRNRLVAE